MAKPRISSGGGWAAIDYAVRKGLETGGLLKFYRRMRTRNTCKTCALGMGGRSGGMVNESGGFPEVCKKSLQAQAGDMQGPISESLLHAYPFAHLETLTSAELERLGRIAFPMIAEDGDSHYRRISWDAALDLAAEAFRDASPEEVFFYSSGRSSNEAAFLMQVVARAYGTPNINNCSFYCHNASGVGLSRVYGSGTASVVLEDLGKGGSDVDRGRKPGQQSPQADQPAGSAATARRMCDRRQPAARAGVDTFSCSVGLAEHAVRVDGFRSVPAASRGFRRRAF